MFYHFEKQLQKIEVSVGEKQEKFLLAVFDRDEWVSAMDEIGFEYDWDICYSPISCTKAEYQPGYLFGTFCIPELFYGEGKKREIIYFMNSDFFVIVDQDGFVEKIIQNLQNVQKEHKQIIDGVEIFLYYFLSQLLNCGTSVLEEYEKQMIKIEEEIMTSPVENFQERLIPVRKNLLELECYYDQMGDVLKELKENENEYFEKEKLRYFRTLSERAERLDRKTAKLLEQSKQLRDVYQAQMEVRQNQIMQFLTIVSTIFAPLTLLTGWYGMNFAHMPELAWGYPFVGGVAVFIIIVCILFFKRKKML